MSCYELSYSVDNFGLNPCRTPGEWRIHSSKVADPHNDTLLKTNPLCGCYLSLQSQSFEKMVQKTNQSQNLMFRLEQDGNFVET